MQQPQEGFTTKEKVTRVIDGDTVDVEITRKVRVRLKDCWAPEKKSRDIVEKQKGMASLAHLAAVIDDKEIVLFIPADDKGEIINKKKHDAYGGSKGETKPVDPEPKISQIIKGEKETTRANGYMTKKKFSEMRIKLGKTGKTETGQPAPAEETEPKAERI